MDEDDVNVVPIDDLLPHEEDSLCRCLPNVERVGEDGRVVVHRSFDGREILEAAIAWIEDSVSDN